MSTALKWILGIIIGLLVVAVVVSVGFFAFTRFGGGGLNGAYYGHMWGGGRHMPYYPMPNYGNPGRNLPQAPYRGFPAARPPNTIRRVQSPSCRPKCLPLRSLR